MFMQLVSISVKMATLSTDDKNENSISAIVEEVALLPGLDDCLYTSCYCEENMWHLCDSARKRRLRDLDKCYCVFISNTERIGKVSSQGSYKVWPASFPQIPLWCQKASSQEDGCVVWDYHVIFIYKDRSSTDVYDLDSTQTFPCPFHEYLLKGIRSDGPLKPNYRRMFRVIPASIFLETFASDRSHMLDPDGKWLKPPPDYPPIQTKESANNIQEFINMDPTVGVGKVLNYWEFSDFFMPPKTQSK